MTAEVFMTLLLACSVISSLLTEAIKKATGEQYKLPWNLIVLCVSVLVGLVATDIYYHTAGIQITYLNLLYMVIMGIANWVCAMVGYDKVKQALAQLKK